MGLIEKVAGKKVYLDSNIIIYFLDGNETYKEAVNTIFRLSHERRIEVATGELALTEVFSGLHKRQDTGAILLYEDFFEKSGLITLLPVSRSVFYAAGFLRSSTKLKTPDALHVATAKEHGCDIFVTNDEQLGLYGKDCGIEFLSVNGLLYF